MIPPTAPIATTLRTTLEVTTVIMKTTSNAKTTSPSTTETITELSSTYLTFSARYYLCLCLGECSSFPYII